MIIIGSDHGGFEMKTQLIEHLKKNGYVVRDAGCFDTNSIDYPDIAFEVSKSVLSEDKSLGILVCGTGIGISIAANKIKGIRCALCHNEFTARMSRMHNNANILALGGRVIGIELAKSILETFLSSEFEGGRHATRVDKICNFENNN